jgi:SAM-dependent methyltransferase
MDPATVPRLQPAPAIPQVSATGSSVPELTYDVRLLAASLKKWQTSISLRTIYEDYFRELAAWRVPGRALELGSGIGNLPQFLPDVETSDVVPTPYAHHVVSAYALPKDFTTFILVDVLHHLDAPFKFLAAAAEVLPMGGRVVMLEPAGGIGARVFYGLFHAEPCRPGAVRAPAPEVRQANGTFANMGMAEAVFARLRSRPDIQAWLEEHRLRVVHLRYRDLLSYPATGGYSAPQFFRPGAVRWLMRWERKLPQWFLRHFALRMVIVLERY